MCVLFLASVFLSPFFFGAFLAPLVLTPGEKFPLIRVDAQVLLHCHG